MLCLQDPPVPSSVVSERVPQENEDEDDAGGCQRRTGDIKQPCCLGILHCSVQVIQELLVPNLETKGRGREVEVRGGSGMNASREGERESVLRKEEGGRRKKRGRCQRPAGDGPAGKGTVAIRGGGGRKAEVRRGGRTKASRPRGTGETEERRRKPIREWYRDECRRR